MAFCGDRNRHPSQFRNTFQSALHAGSLGVAHDRRRLPYKKHRKSNWHPRHVLNVCGGKILCLKFLFSFTSFSW